MCVTLVGGVHRKTDRQEFGERWPQRLQCQLRLSLAPLLLLFPAVSSSFSTILCRLRSSLHAPSPHLVVLLCRDFRVVQPPHPAWVNALTAAALEQQLQLLLLSASGAICWLCCAVPLDLLGLSVGEVNTTHKCEQRGCKVTGWREQPVLCLLSGCGGAADSWCALTPTSHTTNTPPMPSPPPASP